MNWQKIFLNVVVGSSLILLFSCSGSKKVILQEEANEINYIPYYLKVYEADSLYWVGNYRRSFEILDSLFEKYEPLNQVVIYEMQTYVKSAYLMGNYTVLKPTFKRLIDTWGYKTSSLEYDSIMYEAWNKANINEKEIILWQQEWKSKINWTLRDTLIRMNVDDQLFRGKDRGKETMREDSVDLVHINLLKNIFNKQGYPDFRIVGYPKYRENTDLRTVFNHISGQMNESDYKFFQDELIKFLKQGKSTQHQIAILRDKKNFDREKVTVYGTFGTHESFGEKMVKFDTLEINRNRRSIGLPSIQYDRFKEEIFNSMYNQ